MKLTHFGKIVNGIKVYNNPKQLAQHLKELEGQDFEETLEKRIRRRTNPMNRYYHAVVVNAVFFGLRDLGHEINDPEEAHVILKTMFNKKRVVDKDTGDIISEYPGSTAKMSISEMQDYWADIAQWAAENLGLEVPEPRAVMGDEFVKMQRAELKKVA